MNNLQNEAYKRFIHARNSVSLGQYRRHNKDIWQPTTDISNTVCNPRANHPLYESNDAWLEYKAASSAWWAVEPEYRADERLRASRGDYGRSDNWVKP